MITSLGKNWATYIKSKAIFTRKGISKCASKFHENLYKVKDGTSCPHTVQGPVAPFEEEVDSRGDREPDFFFEEISTVINELNNNKVVGTDSLM